MLTQTGGMQERPDGGIAGRGGAGARIWDVFGCFASLTRALAMPD